MDNGIDFAVDQGNGQDCLGHGTKVASAAAGATFGVAKGANIVSVRVVDCVDFGTSVNTRLGFEWIASHIASYKPAVVSISLQHLPAYDQTGASALDTAVNNLVAGGTPVVVAAGNNNANTDGYTPSRNGAAIIVGGTNTQNNRFSVVVGGVTFASNYGSLIDIWAPGQGVGIRRADGAADTDTGTSFAAPLVAGVVARFLQLDPCAEPEDISDALRDNRVNGVGNREGSPDGLVHAGFLNSKSLTPCPTPPGGGGGGGGGRWKDDGNDGCYFDLNDSGPNQCTPADPPTGRWKDDGNGNCYWDTNDSGGPQCYPSGRWKDDGNGGCYFDQWDSGSDQCSPAEPSQATSIGTTAAISSLALFGFTWIRQGTRRKIEDDGAVSND